MIFAVVDTNVWVSSLISKNPDSPTKKVIRLILEGLVTPLYDEDILNEYNEVLKRDKFHLIHSEIDAILDFVREYGVHTTRTTFEDMMVDEDDRVFYEISLTIEESFLVTGNTKHYPKTPKIVTPSEFLEIISK